MTIDTIAFPIFGKDKIVKKEVDVEMGGYGVVESGDGEEDGRSEATALHDYDEQETGLFDTSKEGEWVTDSDDKRFHRRCLRLDDWGGYTFGDSPIRWLYVLWIPLPEIKSPFVGGMGFTTAASDTAILGYLAVVSDSPTHDFKTYWTCLSYPTVIILTIFTIVFLAFGEDGTKSKERDIEMGGYNKVQGSGEDGGEEDTSDVTLKEPQESDVTEVAKEEEIVSSSESSRLLKDDDES
ncbi:hypothetical protein BDZ45DRAFT_736529 [Acephala macrosclerotiorum]|nr:hypothetical protein BDZ45DRAFT_736529 [Acephala macrosclerotiorum]